MMNFSRLEKTIVSVLFQDRIGLAIFLGAIVYFGFTWRIGVFISDNITLANSLINLADGSLSVHTVVYGPEPPNTPGMHAIDGQLFGRNFGQLVLSLPTLGMIQGFSHVANLRVLLSGAWSIILIWFSYHLWDGFEYERILTSIGAVIGIAFFVINLKFYQSVDPIWIPYVALQLTSIVVAAFVGVTLYRIIWYLENAQIAVFTGVTAVLATPIAFWATIPKRHVFTGLLALIALFGFVKSRDRDTWKSEIRYRSIIYISIAIMAWIHAAEGLLLLAVAGPLDLITANSRDRKTIAVLSGVFVIALVPFFLTNYLISGNPVLPPRLLPDFDPSVSPSGGISSSQTSSRNENVAGGIIARFKLLGELLVGGFSFLLTQSGDVYQALLRSGGVSGKGHSLERNLSLLESTPIIGLLAAGLISLISQGRYGIQSRITPSPSMAFVYGYVFLMLLLYLPRLPLHAMALTRYLAPTVPFLLIIVVRLPAFKQTIKEHWWLVLGSWTAIVLIGGQLWFVGLVESNLTLSEAIQIHGILNLVVGLGAGLWLGIDRIYFEEPQKITGVILALPLAFGTLLIIFSAFEYFYYGEFVLSAIDAFADAVFIFR